MSKSARFPASPTPQSMHDSPGAPERSSWYSRFAEMVKTDLRKARTWNRTEPIHRLRIHENVDRTAYRRRRAYTKWQSHTIRCFIAICIAATLVTAALVGAMIAIAKRSKDFVKLDASLMHGSSTYPVPETDARTTSRSTESTSIPWSTTTATSGVFTVDNSATSTQYNPPAYSKSPQGGSSSFDSAIQITHSSSVHLFTASTERTPSSSTTAISSTIVS
jgi:hypothetical protein